VLVPALPSVERAAVFAEVGPPADYFCALAARFERAAQVSEDIRSGVRHSIARTTFSPFNIQTKETHKNTICS
jgi:hypothetical protein